MKRALINLVKNNKVIYKMYFLFFGLFVKFISLFIRPNKKTFLFLCYGGRKYSCNVKPIYEALLNDDRFQGWSFVWAFRDPNLFSLPDTNRTKKCKVDSLSFYKYALSSKCWITNVSIQRGLNFKRKNNFYLCTWHGFPMKLIGKDSKLSFNTLRPEKIDLMISEGSIDNEILSKAFDTKEVITTGYPRNDQMFIDNGISNKIKKEYNIPKDKKIILYAPTYRDYEKDSNGGYSFESPIDFNEFYNRFGDRFVLMVRAHGAIENKSIQNSQIIDVSNYPHVEHLLLCADILISDYSGIIFDYALLDKPIICFWYDIDAYITHRGLYKSVLEKVIFLKVYSCEELYSVLDCFCYEEEAKKSSLFVNNVGLLGKGSTDRVINELAKRIIIN